MNFLGHAYLAKDHPQFIAGNFAGDAFKGKIEKFDSLPDHLYNGIKLHRFIDHYTDQHEDVKEVVKLFWREGVQKVSFIGSDIILDHYLSKNWRKYSEHQYPDFVDYIYQHTDPEVQNLPGRFQFMYEKLKEYGWLYDYRSIEGIEKILSQFSRRIGFENELVRCARLYEDNKSMIDRHYHSFLEDISIRSEDFIRDNLL